MGLQQTIVAKERATPLGRPSTYSQEIAETICNRMAAGESLIKICETSGIPQPATIFDWLNKHDEFAYAYERAREVRAERIFEEALKIADQTTKTVIRDRLRVDTRKWFLSRMFPEKYGERAPAQQAMVINFNGAAETLRSKLDVLSDRAMPALPNPDDSTS